MHYLAVYRRRDSRLEQSRRTRRSTHHRRANPTSSPNRERGNTP
nr:MAG TPA: hypothetical protein [Caudoviricetes sp.]